LATFTGKENRTNYWAFKQEQVKEIRSVIPGYFENKEKLHEIQNNLSSELPFNPQVRVVPIHEIIETLIERINTDKDIRRKRYPVSALELIRWLTRCYKVMDFKWVQE